MEANRRLGRKPAGRLRWLCGPAVILTLVAGCAQPQKSGAVKSTAPQVTEKTAPAATPSKPAPSAAPDKAAPGVASNKLAPSAARQPAAPATATDKPALAARKSAVEKARERKVEPRPAPAQPGAATQPAAEAAKKEGCCGPGSPTAELTPPPPDQPQPKLVCKETKVVAAPVWQGKMAEFTFTISNEGEAPLAIRVKPT